MKVAFLDRDGVINKDTGYAHKIEEFEFAPGCIAGLKLLQSLGYHLIIVTNQSGIGRGYYSESDYQVLTHWYIEQLSGEGITITDVFHCPHAPDVNCECRKPNSGLFLQAAEKYTIDFSQSLMIGDKPSDIEAAQKVGISQCYLFNDNALNSVLDCATSIELDIVGGN